MTVLHAIETKYLPDYWDILGPFIDKAASRYSNEYDLEHVWNAILDEKCLLFGIEHDGEFVGAMTVAPVNQPKRKTLTIELVGGNNAKRWYKDTTQQLATMAKKAGYDAISSNARRGWRNMARDSGFTETSITYEMELG